ncbi:hypothetical protein [Burkholderia sp. Bp9143]|nr:hypothetical protein [Burkholderia sp. Bp9143]
MARVKLSFAFAGAFVGAFPSALVSKRDRTESVKKADFRAHAGGRPLSQY